MNQKEKPKSVNQHYFVLLLGLGFVGWRLTFIESFQSLDYLALAVGVGVILSSLYMIRKSRRS